jgi:hypothetical protein
MSILKVRIEQLLNLTHVLEHMRYSDTDYSEVRRNIEAQFPNTSNSISTVMVKHERKPKKAPAYMSFEKHNLRRIKGFKITQKDLSDLIGKTCSITFYGPGNEPMYRKGLIIELYHHYVRLETHVSARHYFIQYFRIIKVVEFEGKHAIKEIWYDKKNH